MTGLLAWAGYQGLPDDPKDWPPEEKVRLITAMGFTPTFDEHNADCPARMDPEGFICICVPSATFWVQPKDVDEFRHETWGERVAARKAQSH